MACPALAVLLLLACRAVAQPQTGGHSFQDLQLDLQPLQDFKGPSFQAPATVPIYANGSFAQGWLDASRGCIKCTFDVEEPHGANDLTAAIRIAPWGELALANQRAFSAGGVLDFWAKGSGLALIGIFIQDDVNRRWSRDVRLAHGADVEGLTISEYDGANWMRVQLNLQTLVEQLVMQLTDPGWTKIVFRDVSGLGFFLRLDSVQLVYSPSVLVGFGASSFDPLLQPFSLVAPVYNDDYPQTMSNPSRYIMRMRSSVKAPAVWDICRELNGTMANVGMARRFQGACVSATPKVDLSNPGAWKFLTVDVASPGDLQAMRSALSDKVAYFEQDLLAYALPTGRALHVYNADPEDWVKPVTSAELQREEASGWPSRDSLQEVWTGNETSGNTTADGMQQGAGPSNGTLQVALVAGQVPDCAGNASSIPSTQVQNSTSPCNSTHASAQLQDGLKNASIAIMQQDQTSDLPQHDHQQGALPDESGVVTTAQVTAGDASAAGQLTAATDAAQDQGKPSQDAANVMLHASEFSAQSSAPWGLDRIDQVNLPLDGAYSPGSLDGRNVHVYVLDTGIRSTHVDFKDRIGTGVSLVGSSNWDDNGHGSHVAGIAAGSLHGVARSATIHAVKVLQSDGSGSFSTIIEGMRWVKDHKTRNGYPSAVVVMSLGGPRSASLNDAVADLARAGVTVVVAAGNNRGADSCTMSPASASGAIAVGSSTDADSMSSFSNIGTCLALFAPGSAIVSASYRSDTGEAIMSGTSMAAPHVAGAAALYLQLRPGAAPSEVRSALQKAAASKYFESTSPQRLLNVMEQRLRAAMPSNTGSSGAAAPATAPRPAPAPQPAAPAPAPATPSTQFPSAPSICATCPWCMFCS